MIQSCGPSSSVGASVETASFGLARIGTYNPSDRLASRAWRLIEAHPYLAISVVLHALAAAVLLSLPGIAETERATLAAAERARAAQQIAQTERRALQRRVERMEVIARSLGADSSAMPPASLEKASVAALAARAQLLSTVIDAEDRRLRAVELARLTGMSTAEATRDIEAQSAAERPPSAASAPTETVERLERRAKQTLEARRSQLAAQRDGVRLTRASASAPAPAPRAASPATAPTPPQASPGATGQARVAGGIPRSRVEQLAAMLRPGPPQGRVGVAGVQGGLSVNREGVEGVAGGRHARPDDPDPSADIGFGAGPPVKVAGLSIDLTHSATNSRDDLIRYVQPKGIDPATLRTGGAGRVFGAGGMFATRAYLDSWYVIGPFPGHGESTLETLYPPEEDIDLDAVYPGLDGRTLTWQYASRGFYPFIPPDRAEDAVYYAYTELRIDRDCDVWLAIAGDDDTMLWLDGRLIWTSEHGDKPWYHPPYYLRDELVASLALAEGHRRVHLQRGVHRLLLKLFNDRDRTFFSVVVSP